ncbi:TolC family protein [Nitrospirillum viridazoti]|uniref:Transporter n=1 Tax=Nitrospirillum viridazoti CBAmc TaxID=1441467 RepID=A0A248K072_9PROT|nr:TolC family protein [Nitrospirillum amazonense]ASG24131.1 transporter [Nitrospirillum amazonense CBAmc]TWB40881.1 outer membrane protein TolC [Nitrospirillum amazonense]
MIPRILTSRGLGGLLALSCLAGCASYSPAPLADAPDLAQGLAGITVDPAAMPLPALRRHMVDPARPLDVDAVAMVAVARNPELKAARAQHGVAVAEAFTAGLLPNPQLSVDYGFLTSGPAVMDAFTIGLMQDVMPFLTRSSRKDAAAATLRGAELDLLWQEWQVVSQARLLVVRAQAFERQRAVLEANRALFADRYRRTSTAMGRGDETLPNVVSDLAALNGVEAQLHDLEQQALRNRMDLNALLGLTPTAPLALAPLTAGDLPLPPVDRIRADLPQLAGRRPDLLALKAGYQAQEQAVWQAVLGQFPALSIGSNRARDTSNVKTQSLALSISLPLFDGNQGAIAVQRATREQLRQDYQARLDAAVGGVGQGLLALDQLEAQARATADSITTLERAAADADAAFRAGSLDERTFVDLQGALLSRRLEALKLDQAVQEQRVDLMTLIGGDVPENLGTAPDAIEKATP